MVVGTCVAETEEPARVLSHKEREGMSVNGKMGGDDLEHPA